MLRTWVSGWREEFVATGARIRPVALAALSAYVGHGGDVVLAQLVADPDEQGRFERAAVSAGGRYVHVLIEADDVGKRFAGRATDQPWLAAVHALVEAEGPDHLAAYAERLSRFRDAIRLPTRSGDVDGASAALDEVIATLGECPRSPGDGG